MGSWGWGVEVALRQQARRVATGGPGVLLAKARDIGVDGPPGVAPEQGGVRRHGQAEVPGPAQGVVLGGRAKAPAGLFVAGKLDVVTEQRQIEAGAQAGGRDQDPLTVNELLAHLDLVRRQGADMAPGVAQGLDRRGAAIDGALALGGIETGQEIGEDRRRRRVAAQVQPVGLGLVEGLEEAAHQAREGDLARAFMQEVVAGGGDPGQTDAGLAKGMLQEPGVEFGLDLGQQAQCLRGVGGDDEELARGIDDLAGGRQG